MTEQALLSASVGEQTAAGEVEATRAFTHEVDRARRRGGHAVGRGVIDRRGAGGILAHDDRALAADDGLGRAVIDRDQDAVVVIAHVVDGRAAVSGADDVEAIRPWRTGCR